MDLQGSETFENLKKAFARESEANRRYLWFAEAANVEGHPEIANLFRSIAEGETGHANGHLEFLAEVGDPTTGEPIGDTIENLRSAIVGETFEFTTMYPEMADTARREGFTEVAGWMESLAQAEKAHAARFAEGLEGLS